MFTNNYIAFRHNMFYGLLGAGASAHGIYSRPFKNLDGVAFDLYRNSTDLHYKDIGHSLTIARCTAMSAASNDHGVYFGSGSTPATREDYKLESPITSGLRISNDLKVLYNEDGSYTVSGLYMVTNTSAEDLNIYEIGCFENLFYNVDNRYLVMMDRTVLTEPINIKAGETKVVTYDFNFNHILNVEA